MKTIIKTLPILTIYLVFLLIFSACSQGKGMENVRKKVGGEVSAIPGKDYNFIIRRVDGSIWYAFSSGISDTVISECQLLPPIK